MDSTKQRIAIAEACGYKHAPVETGVKLWYLWPEDLPDYLSDLNVMHEAEKTLGKWADTLTTEIEQRFTDTLIEVCSRQDTWYSHATAAQRAEAFLKTLGLWRDDAGEAS